jgi:hypothetical protein
VAPYEAFSHCGLIFVACGTIIANIGPQAAALGLAIAGKNTDIGVSSACGLRAVII